MDTIRGRTAISERAFTRAFAAIAADELGVDAGAPRVGITDRGGRLAVAIVAPIALAPIGRASRVSGSTAQRPMLVVAESARRRVLDEGAVMTGALVGDVTLRLDSAVVVTPGRVR